MKKLLNNAKTAENHRVENFFDGIVMFSFGHRQIAIELHFTISKCILSGNTTTLILFIVI